jgi:multiple sugar transport system permease protein
VVTIPLIVILVVQLVQIVTHRENLTVPGSGDIFAGWSNFTRAFSDPNLGNSIWVTVLYCVFGVGFEMIIGVGIALLLNGRIPGKGVVRALVLIPMVLTPVVAALTWRLLLDPTAGTINYLLGVIGLGYEHAFLGSTATALPAVIIVEIWQNTPFVVIIVLAGLESLDTSPLEAAQIDGASGFRLIRHVVLPMIRPVLAIVLLLRLIDSVKTFALINTMTQGGPGTSTMAISNYVYQVGFNTFDIGYATTVGLLVSIAVLVLLFPAASRLMGLRLRKAKV